MLFNRLVPNRVYRVKNDSFTVPFITKTPTKGSLITVLSEDTNMTIDFLNSPYIEFKRYDRYFLKRKVVESFEKQRAIERNDKKSFEENFGKYFPKSRLIFTPQQAYGYNLVYELGQYDELLINSKKINAKTRVSRSMLRSEYIVDKLEEITSTFPEYQKYLYIPVDFYITNPKSPSIWVGNSEIIDNLGVAFIRHFDVNYESFKTKFRDWKFIFVNRNEMFYMNMSELDEKTPTIIRSLFKKFNSNGSHIDTTEADDEDLTSNEKENDRIILEKNVEKLNNYSASAKKKIDSLDISQEAKDQINTIISNSVIAEEEKVNHIKDHTKDKPVEKKQSENKKEEPQAKSKLSSTLITKSYSEDKIEDEMDDNELTGIDDHEENQENTQFMDIEKLDKKVEDKIKNELRDANMPKDTPRLARMKKIEQEMKSLKLNDKGETIEDLAKRAETKKIEDHNIKSSVINPHMKNIKFDNFEKGYNEKLLDYDTMNILMSFAKKDRPLYLISVDKEDTSTTSDKKYTYKCVFEDEKGRRHHMTFDMPKFVNNKFIFLNGSDKIFINQIIPLPVTKVAQDTVQMSSAYNKIFITRFGRNASVALTKIFKLFTSVPHSLISYEKGNVLSDNNEYATSMDYDEMSKRYKSITLKKKDITIYFSQPEIRSICESENLVFDDETELPFAIQIVNTERTLLVLDINSGNIKTGNADESISLIDFIVDSIDDPTVKNEFSKIQGSKKSIYTRAKIMNKQVPVILLLSFLRGLDKIMDKLKCNYTFTETKPKYDSTKRGCTKFSDGYLCYDLFPYNNSLLLSGLYDIPTEEYSFFDLCEKDIYYDIFAKLFGRRTLGSAFENFEQLFIDPVTKEVLEDFNLPTDFIDLTIYANSLLENNTFDKEGDLKNYRLRSNEMINDHLYKCLSKAYERYHSTADNKNPTKFDIKQNEVINNMFDSQVMEEYSNLNPIFEMDRMRSTSYKGPGGCNIDNGFKIEKRAYNDSMLGVLAQSSPLGGNIGISRILSLNPNITSLRGYIETGDISKKDKLNETNMFSGAELLVPMTGTKDDPQRVGMASTQSRHTLGVMDSDVPLFGYGTDKILAKMISDKFAFKAKGSGTVTEINEELGYMLVKYKNGSSEVIDITDRQLLNTGSGFYINSKLEPLYKVGDKFEEGDVLAANSQFFQNDELNHDVIYKSGPLARVAMVHGSFVYEDSTLVTEEFASRMVSYVDEVKEIRLGKNSNIYHYTRKGDKIKVNEPFLVFDESYEDEYLNKILEKMNEVDKKNFIESSRTNIKSKWNGEIADVKIFYTCPKSELSPSLRKMINEYEKPIIERRKRFEEAGVNIKDMTSLNEEGEPTIPVNGKIEGVKMEEFNVLIRFFVKTIDNFSVGDKMAFGTALKGINQSLIPAGKAPYLVSDPNIKIDAFMGVTGFYARMTNSASVTMAINTLLMGAEARIKDILEDKEKKISKPPKDTKK